MEYKVHTHYYVKRGWVKDKNADRGGCQKCGCRGGYDLDQFFCIYANLLLFRNKRYLTLVCKIGSFDNYILIIF